MSLGNSPAPHAAALAVLRILTFNLGLLGFRMPGICFVPMADHVQRRLEAAPRQLIGSGADIVALQEVYDRRHRRYLANAVKDTYPYAYGVGDRWSMFSNGLMVLSRHPIVSGSYAPAPGFGLLERAISRKGYLCVEIEVPNIGRLRLINVHLTVSGMFFPSVERVDDERRRDEIAHLVHLADGSDSAILLGDFNCSPDVHGNHYRHITDAGYVDSFVAAGETGDGFTWDVANALNRNGPYKNSPSQRIDHIFIPRALLARLSLVGGVVTFDEPSVSIGGSKRVTLSDHYGMMASFVAIQAASVEGAARRQEMPA
jgi:endonuclease/exonuclease/phosphatase family metal-dependent hydrolase